MIKRFGHLLQTNKSLSLINNGATALLGIIIYALLARSFSIADLGYYSFFMSVFTMTGMLGKGLVSNAMIRKINEYDTAEGKNMVIGSAWQLSIIVNMGTAILVSGIFYVIYLMNDTISYLIIAKWFVPLSFVSLFSSMATWTSNAEMQFGRLIIIRLSQQLLYFIGIVYHFYNPSGLNLVLTLYFMSSLISVVFIVVAGWDRLKYIVKGTRKTVAGLFHFGKYSFGTMMGSTFLRGSDTFIIMSFLGPQANAIYDVSQRLMGLFDIPLRSFVIVSFPQLSRTYSMGSQKEFKNQFKADAGFSTLLLLPVSILTLIFAEPLVIALAGEQYIASADILRVFAVYTALTPLERFTGVAFDVVNRPDLNFMKVVVMLGANIVGDILVLQFTDSLLLVAAVSVVTFATGIFFGFMYLRPHVHINIIEILEEGLKECRRLLKKYLKR